MNTLAQINTLLENAQPGSSADLTAIIGDIKAAVRTSDAGVIDDLTKQLAQAKTDSDAAAVVAKTAADKALADAVATQKKTGDDTLAASNAAYDKLLLDQKAASEKAAADAQTVILGLQSQLDAATKAAADAKTGSDAALAMSKTLITQAIAERDTLAASLQDHQGISDTAVATCGPLLTQAAGICAANPILAPLGDIVGKLIAQLQAVSAGPEGRAAAAKAAQADALKKQLAALGVTA